MTLLPVFYANREPFGKMLTLIDFAFGKKKKIIIVTRIFTSSFYIFLLVFILVNGVALIFLNKLYFI